eukprot:9040341-Pyramimonas_sp.AAC.1
MSDYSRRNHSTTELLFREDGVTRTLRTTPPLRVLQETIGFVQRAHHMLPDVPLACACQNHSDVHARA